MDNENKIVVREPRFCSSCNSIVDSELLYEYDRDEYRNDVLQGGGVVVKLFRCPRCQAPFLIEIDYGYDMDQSWENSNNQLFPSSDNKAIKNCPLIVIRPYIEAKKCYWAQSYDACVIMCRKGIEAICKDNGESTGPLISQLRNMKDRGVLGGTLFDWADELRLIGNDGAHSHEQIVTKEYASDALIFFDALIMYLYHLADQYKRLKERRHSQ